MGKGNDKVVLSNCFERNTADGRIVIYKGGNELVFPIWMHYNNICKYFIVKGTGHFFSARPFERN